ERLETELRATQDQRRRPPVVQIAQEQERGIGPSRLQRVQLRPLAEETLCQQRHRGRRAGHAQVIDRTPEPLVDKDRNRAGACGRELGCELARVGIRPHVTRRRRAAFDLRDRAKTGCGKSVTEAAHCVTASPLCVNAISSSNRAAAAPESTARRASSSPSRRSSACPPAAIAPAALSRIALRRPPFSPAKTARIAAALSCGEPPRSSPRSQRSSPNSSGSMLRARTPPFTTSQTKLGPAGDSSSIP